MWFLKFGCCGWCLVVDFENLWFLGKLWGGACKQVLIQTKSGQSCREFPKSNLIGCCGFIVYLCLENESTLETLTLHELNEYIRQVVILNFGQSMWVTCEISQLNLSRGHRYLELIQKDEQTEDIVARIGAVIWSRDYASLRRKHRDSLALVLAEANEVRLLVSVDFHERFGLKLMIKDVDLNYTMGQFAERRLQIIRRLEMEDLLDVNRSVPFSSAFQRIAVISSETAAGFADFRAHLAENEYGYDFRVHLFPAAMQGKQVVPEILTQLAIIKKRRKEFDVVIIIRGGGSKIDLSDFDSYELGKMIATYPLPVFTGIGHEIDESVVDMVSAKSFKTPTAVAGFLVRYNMETEQNVLMLEDHLVTLAQNILSEKKVELDNLIKFIPVLASSFTQRVEVEVEQLSLTLKRLFAQAIKNEENRLTHLLALIQTTRPENILRKGYSITYKNKEPILDLNKLEVGDEVETHVKDGKFRSKINKIIQ